MTDTLLLDVVAWDLCLDASGNIAVASAPYAMAQDVASAQRTFQGEVWYDTTQGVPYLDNILGRAAGAQLLKVALVEAALTVPNVASAVCYLELGANRQVTGQTQVTSTSGQTVVATTAAGSPYVAIVTGDGRAIAANGGILVL